MKTNNANRQDSELGGRFSPDLHIYSGVHLSAVLHLLAEILHNLAFGLMCITAVLGHLPKVIVRRAFGTTRSRHDRRSGRTSLTRLACPAGRPSEGYTLRIFGRLSLILFFPLFLFAQAPTVVSFTPTRNALNVEKNTNIIVTFDRDIDQSTINNSTIKINGSLSGPHTPTFSYNGSTYTTTIDPSHDFQVGDIVTVTLTRGIKSAAGDSLAKNYSCSFTIKASQGSAIFIQNSTAKLWGNPKSVTTGDFNGDGTLDLAVVDTVSNTVSILMNDGSGVFTQSSTISVGSSPWSVTAGDFNGDGTLDLAVSNYVSNTVSILMNDGSGVFTQSSTTNVEGLPMSVVSGDFNGDGTLDLAVANSGSDTVSILINDGSGVFTQSSTISVGSSPWSVAVGDFNGDGTLDLAVANCYSNTVSILINDGSGVFTQSSILNVGWLPRSVTEGDFNGDGTLDLAVSNFYSKTVSILMNDGSGVFTQSSTPSVVSLPISVAAGDFNSDGALDLAVANSGSDIVSILINNGRGVFTKSSTPSVESSPWSFAIGDFNGDGTLDLAVANEHSLSVSILLNRPSNATVRLSSLSINFSGVKSGNSKNQYLTIFNIGTDNSLVISNITSSNSAFTFNRTLLTILPGEMDSIQVTFTPPAPGITYSDSLTITSNDPKKPTVKVYVTGSSFPPTPALISPINGAIGVPVNPTFTWNAATGATSYYLQVSTDSLFQTFILNDSTISNKSKQVSSLAYNTLYYWRVSAKNIGGSSGFSDRWSFRTIIGTPNLLLPANGSLNVSITPTLSWSSVIRATSYRLQVSTDASFSTTLIDDSTITGTLHQVSPLSNDTKYYWRVCAKDSFSTGAFSGSANFTTIVAAPSIPTLVSPNDGTINQSLTPTLQWNVSPRATSYRLQLSTDSLFTTTIVDDSSITATSQSVSSLTVSTRYFWRVSAKNIGGKSDFSAYWSFVTIIPAPTNIIANPGNKKITLNWTASGASNILRYRIYRGTATPASILHDSTTITSFVDTGLTNNIQYFYRITSVNTSKIEGTSSNEVSAQPYNQPPHALKLNDINQPNAGRILKATLQFSSQGSTDADGTVDSTLWYMEDQFISKAPSISYDFGPGTTKVLLVVKDNDGATDTTQAFVNRTVFRSTVNGPIYAGLSLLGDSLLYAVATGDAVYRMDYNGNKVYDLQVGGAVRSSSSISYDTTVYIASSDKNLYAFSKNGVPVWAPVPLGGELSATPAIDSLLNRLYIGVSNRNFFGINRKTGVVDWSLFADAPIQQSAVLTSDRKLVFTTAKGTIYGIDLAAQPEPTSATWTLSLGDTITSSPAIDFDGNFYAGTYSGKVIKVSLPQGSDAQIVWQVQTGGTVIASPLIDSKGTVFVGSTDKKLYALDGATGNTKWIFTTSDKIRSTAALSNSGVVYVANDAGEVFALDSAALIKWYYQDSSAISAPLLFQKGTLYAGTESGKIVALFDGEDVSGFHKTNQSLTVPIWGTFQGNNQRTGAQHIVGAVVARVYPGDANNDGIVDVRDILPIGRYYAATGTLRQNASSNWSVQLLISAWNPFNACYADCDGNGTVDAQDVNVIIQNWQARQGGNVSKNIDRRLAAEELLKAIDSQPQSEAMKAIRSSIVNYMEKNLGIVFTFCLNQNYPNPFNPSTTIRFVLPEATTTVKLVIYNIVGQCVYQTNMYDLDPGDHFFGWNGSTSDGKKLASGVYIYRLDAGKYSAQNRMILLK